MKPSVDTAYALHYGTANTALVRVVPHSVHRGMWLMVWPDGQQSDFGNLTRIKEAAEVICARGSDSTLLHWKHHPYEKPLEAPPVDLTTKVAA
jgi:hypothetical protein